MKLKVFFCIIIAAILVVCNPYGKKQMVGQIELYVKDSITTDQAAKTAAFLREIKYDDIPISIQVDKANDVYLLRFTIKAESMNDRRILDVMPVMKEEAAKEIFGGQKVQIDLCDENFKTVKSF